MDCEKCSGKGKIREPMNTDGTLWTWIQTCNKCKGTGKFCECCKQSIKEVTP